MKNTGIKILKNKNFKLIRNLAWEEVFLFWYKNEGVNKSWINLAKKRGFNSWADWRINSYIKPFKCAQATWSLYQVNNPSQVVPNFYGGPFKAWIKHYYEGKREKIFNELASQDNIVKNKSIQNIIKKFPKDSVIICLEVGNKIYTIEGMHRCCALSTMKAQKKLAPRKMNFIIGKSKLKRLPIVGQVPTL